ncbi:hypothetical protein CkaCkLH20_09643 [Colletotrichum karsti]|uniref:Uncharacterized protein n=1 Tax=Colletotrichum karsti TaxID=1095194 RepID=A0A9P6HZ19_9PEZI|nr:uncharacterized protein CkaCkLH20_09643 [Colletotrichum karsti]KAF9872780.1 hypothetical protein CkaCkLH20_09643 [Colletotrichum karsti]
MSLYRSMPRRNLEGQVSLAKWPTSTPSRSPAWDVDDSTAQTVSKLNSYFGFRPPTAYGKSALASPAYSPELPHLYPDGTPELRHDTPSDVRTRTSSFGPETPPTKFDPSFQSEPHVQPPTPARHGHSHLRSYSDGCSLHSFRSDHGAASESMDYDHKPPSHAAMMSRAGDNLSYQAPAQEPLSPHHNYTVNLTRDNRAVTLCLTSGESPNPAHPTITCYRQTYLPIGGQCAEFFKASEALSLLQHMVNAPSQPFVPFTRQERVELMRCMRHTDESMILGEPCSNARAWTTFFSAELAAGRAWEAKTVIFPWAVLQKLMNSLNSEWRKRKLQANAATPHVFRDKDEPTRTRGLMYYGYSLEPRTFSLSLSESSTPPDVIVDHHSAPSASPPPRTPTEPNPPARIQFMRAKSPPSSSSPIRRRRQNSEPVRRLSLSPPRIALLKSNPCRQSLRRLHAASTPSRLVFYDSIRTWPASSHRSRVRLPPCSKFLELTADRGADARNPIML